MWIRTERNGSYNTDNLAALRCIEQIEGWCLKFPYDPGHPTIKVYPNEEECFREYNEIMDELEKPKSKQKVVMKI